VGNKVLIGYINIIVVHPVVFYKNGESTASIPYVLHLFGLLINGWPEDGLLKVETCSHPQHYFNIILELCLTDSSVDIPLNTFSFVHHVVILYNRENNTKFFLGNSRFIIKIQYKLHVLFRPYSLPSSGKTLRAC
jgi:hypothetical protein